MRRVAVVIGDVDCSREMSGRWGQLSLGDFIGMYRAPSVGVAVTVDWETVSVGWKAGDSDRDSH